jgi:putative nucleotidyltransferase with HDIG domain
MAEKTIHRDQLKVGLFIHLDLPWMKHPFMTNRFKIRNEKQLQTLKKLRLTQITIDTDKSDSAPAPMPQTPSPLPPVRNDLEQALWEEKKQRIEVLKARRSKLNHCANRYGESVGSVRKLMAKLFASPAEAAKQAEQVVSHMVDELTTDHEVTIQLINMKGQDESTYFHVINVAALSLVLGRNLGLDKEQLRILGLGALFHDIGHQRIPSQILRKKAPLNPAEQQFYQRHPVYGVQIANKLGTLPRKVTEIIAQHHECLDGSGYPKGLKVADISFLSRIVSLVNRYDNLCNRATEKGVLSPYQAVSQMYAREKTKYDGKILTAFIANLGVYPPGTVVELSDQRIAVVVSINPKELLKPNVLVYDPQIPKEEALIIDLTEEDLSICSSKHGSELDPAIFNYLNLSENISYYYERSAGPEIKRIK